ncbi:hypothetical protein RR48_15480 [Papilio machaon]|uniref:Uncharacterized protein n=1 Tax=Papilio machaon TaxID=76193 RepID=A0A194QVI9_PAPMA|nr:hypothetical protein RR48_15480 [Papilio machaon]
MDIFNTRGTADALPVFEKALGAFSRVEHRAAPGRARASRTDPTSPSPLPTKLAHQFWISYHPHTGAKHTSSGDETPPFPQEDLEKQIFNHEERLQKEKNSQAREDEEVRQLDKSLLYQRAIGAEEEHKQKIKLAKARSLQESELESHKTISLNINTSMETYDATIEDSSFENEDKTKKPSTKRFLRKNFHTYSTNKYVHKIFHKCNIGGANKLAEPGVAGYLTPYPMGGMFEVAL